MDTLTFFLVDISFSQNDNEIKASSIALLLITTLITVLIYFSTIQNIPEERIATDMDQWNFRFYGIYHFGLVALPLLPVFLYYFNLILGVFTISSFSQISIASWLYFYREEIVFSISLVLINSSVIIPFTFILILTFPLLSILISSYWQFWITFFILSFCFLDFFVIFLFHSEY